MRHCGEIPGIECYANRDGHDAKRTLLFSASGKIISEPFPPMIPLEWDGDDVRELTTRNGKSIGKFDGRDIVPMNTAPPNEAAGNVVMAGDLVGDFRDEIVVVGPNAEGNLTVSVYSPTTPMGRRKVTRTAKHAYRMWLAHNLTGGYGAYFEPEE